jgi:hypothetical protein
MVDDSRREVASAKLVVDPASELPRMEDNGHKSVSGGKENEQGCRGWRTTATKCGRRQGRRARWSRTRKTSSVESGAVAVTGERDVQFFFKKMKKPSGRTDVLKHYRYNLATTLATVNK